MHVILNSSFFDLLTKKKPPTQPKTPNSSHPISVETTKSPQKFSSQSIVIQFANDQIPFLNHPIIQDHEVLKETCYNIKWNSTPNFCRAQNFVLHING